MKLPDQSLMFQVSSSAFNGPYNSTTVCLRQLYVNRDRKASEVLIKQVDKEGFKGIIFTVDAAVAGKRELDQRSKGNFWEVSRQASRSNSEP